MRRSTGWIAGAAVAAGLAGSPGLALQWSEPVMGGAPVAELTAVTAAALSADRLLLAGLRDESGVAKVFLARSDGGVWSAALGGQPADGKVADGPARSPILAPAGGTAFLVFARHDGVSAWRIYGRWFDGVAMTDLDDGRPADLDLPGATVNAIAATAVDGGELHVLYTQFDGSRMALRGAWYAGGNWQPANDGIALDQGGAGWTDAPAVARDSKGGAVAVYTQETGTGRRLFALRLSGPWLGRTWSPLDEGGALDRPELGNVSSPAVAVTADGRIVVAYLQEDGAGVPRLFVVVREGVNWVRANGGEPLDAGAAGVASLALVPTVAGGVLLAYTSADAAQLFALEVRGAEVMPMNGGAALAQPAGALTGVALAAAGAGGWLVTEQDGGVVRARTLELTRAAAPASATAATAEGLTVTGAVFRPAAGERAGLGWSVNSEQRVRVTIAAITGELVAELADGPMTGRVALAWDGRDAGGRDVAPGVYVVRAVAGSFRQSAKLVVVR